MSEQGVGTMPIQVQQGRTQLKEWSQFCSDMEKISEHVRQEMWIRLRLTQTERGPGQNSLDLQMEQTDTGNQRCQIGREI